MSAKLLTEHHLEFVSLKGGCTGWYESTLAKMSHCWKSHVTGQMCLLIFIHEIIYPRHFIHCLQLPFDES